MILITKIYFEFRPLSESRPCAEMSYHGCNRSENTTRFQITIMANVDASVREEGLKDARNLKLMSMGYPPGPTKSDAKRLNLRDINT